MSSGGSAARLPPRANRGTARTDAKGVSLVLLRASRSQDPLQIRHKVYPSMYEGTREVRALADGVLFEFGPSREQDLAVRDRIRQFQPTLRMLFITRIVLWRYRAGLPGFELPEAMQPAQQEFDNRLATVLDGLADRMDGKASTRLDDLTTAYTQLEQAAWKATPKQQHSTPQMQSFLVLSRRIADLADRVERNI